MDYTTPFKTLSINTLYESITAPIEEGGIPMFVGLVLETLNVMIYTLIEAGKLIPSQNQDAEYCVRINSHNKTVEDIQRESLSLDSLGKVIYHFLLEVPNRLWTIQLGAQKTKTAQMIRCIQELIKEAISSPIRVIPFLFSLNSLDLTDQSMIRFITSLDNVIVFVFASRKMDTSEDELLRGKPIEYNPSIHFIRASIDNYIHGRGPMPLIISLPNPTQLKKVTEVLEYILSLRIANKECGYMNFFDEADAIYPKMRPSLLKYIVDINSNPIPANYGTYWVSATLDIDNSMNFEEVLKAFQYPVYIDSSVEINYRNIDTSDSKILNPFLRQEKKESNNAFDLRIIKEHFSHFMEKVRGRNGVEYNRRTIIVANVENDKQIAFAKKLATLIGGSIVYNQTGITAVWKTPDTTVVTKTIRRKDLPKNLRTKPINEKIKWVYDTTPEIQNAPLFLIGNKMIDRGLSFHYAPRGEEGQALLFTDIILPYYSRAEWRRAAQAVARLWGVIAHRPEYCGTITHWLDARTRELVLRDARKTKHIQDNSYIPQPISYLTQQAEAEIEEEGDTSNRHIIQSESYAPDHRIDFAQLELDSHANGNQGRIGTMRHLINSIKSSRLVEDLRRSIGVLDKEHPTSYKVCDGYIIPTRISRVGVNADGLTSEHRIILNRIGDSPLKTLDEISLTNAVDRPNGRRACQSFTILSLYPNETSGPEELLWIYRYEMPLKDTNGQICFTGDTVLFHDQNCTIQELYPSENGDRVKARLTTLTGPEPEYINEFGEIDTKIPGTQFTKL